MRASALVALAAALGCGGPPCRDVDSALALVRERRAPPRVTTVEPHAQLIVGHRAINRALPGVLATLEPVRLPLPPALKILGVPEIELASRRITVEPAPAGKLAAAIDVEARIAGVGLPLGVVTVEAIPELADRALRIRFAGDAIRELAPSALHRRLWASSYDKLPASLRDRLGRLEFIAAVELAARHFGRAGFGLVRRHLLSRIDRVAALSIALPELPLARAEINRRAPRGAVVVDLWTSLPVRFGVARADPMGSATARVRMSAEAAMELANWAIASGAMPQRYDRDLRPTPDGAYFPVYGWRRGDRRPLEIHLFRFEKPCSVIRLAARPEITSDGADVEVSVSDGIIEKVEGSAAVKVAVWASRLLQGAIEKSRSHAATTAVKAGDVWMRTTVTRAALRDDTVIVELELSPVPRAPRSAAPSAPSRPRVARAAPRPPRRGLARRTWGCRASW